MGKKIGLGIAALLLIIQFFQIEKENPAVDPSKDFINIVQPEAQLANLIKTACYDCHSNESTYPWYSYINPVGWLVSHDIEEGREHLNFSVWGNYKKERANHKLEECYEEIEEGEMPMEIYTLTHADAKLSSEQKELLEDYFKSLIKE